MKPDFMSRTAKIIAELRNRTCIEDDAEFIKEILQEELVEYHNEVFTAGYDVGYDAGYNFAKDEVAHERLQH